MASDPRPLQRGDLVRLAGGGPVMTVDMAPIEMAFVRWYDDDGIRRDGIYPQESLVLVQPAGPAPGRAPE